MNTSFSNSLKEPSLKCLSVIMKEVAEEAKLREILLKENLTKSISDEINRLGKKYVLKPWKNLF